MRPTPASPSDPETSRNAAPDVAPEVAPDAPRDAAAPVRLEVRQGYAVITLNRPEKLNSFNNLLHVQLRQAIAEAGAAPGVAAVLLTGAGRGFCAGQDLAERDLRDGVPPPDLGDSLDRLYNPLIRQLRALPKPVVCAVNGIAAGAGASLALACDIVLAARSASFIQAFCRIGLLPDSGATWTLPRLVGDARARALALLGERISAQQAADWGMIWRCVEDEQLLAQAEALCSGFAAAPVRSLAAIKQALNASAGNSLDAQLDLERDLQQQLGYSADYREGVQAFLGKRVPQFKGC